MKCRDKEHQWIRLFALLAPLSREEGGVRLAHFHSLSLLLHYLSSYPLKALSTLQIISLIHHLLLTAQTQSRGLQTIREEDTASTADTATLTRRSSGLRSYAGGFPLVASRPGAGRAGCRCVSGGVRGGEGWGALGQWSRGSAAPEGED